MNTSLFYFVVVAEEQNITKAANKLYISQQALSKHIMKLEREYNTRLFERGPKLRLTTAGEHMLRYAREVLEAEQNVIRAIDDPNVAHSIKLPIGISSAKGHILMPRIMPEYKKQHPNIIPSIYEGTRNYLDMLLQHGKIDLYLCMKGNDMFYGEFIPLQQDELHFVIGKQLLRERFGDQWKNFVYDHIEGITAEDMSQFPLIFPNEGSTLYAKLNRYFSRYSVNIYSEENNYSSAFKSAVQGMCGIFQSKLFFYDMVCTSDKYENEVFSMPVKDVGNDHWFGVVYDSKSENLNYIVDYIEIARSKVCELEKCTTEMLDNQHKQLRASL